MLYSILISAKIIEFLLILYYQFIFDKAKYRCNSLEKKRIFQLALLFYHCYTTSSLFRFE